MKKLTLLALTVATLASTSVFSNAFAQETTRAEVRQELIQAEDSGSQYITDTSYPVTSTQFALQVAQLKQDDNSGVGVDTAGTSSSGAGMPMHSHSSCVGPASFCNVYFGN